MFLYFWAILFLCPFYGSIFSHNFVLQEGWWSLAKTWDFFLHTWPIIVVGSFVGAGYQMRMMRGNLLDVLNMQFIETARAKGLKESKIVWKHGVPNALHPIIMNQGRSLTYLIEGEIKIGIKTHNKVKNSTLVLLNKGEQLKVSALIKSKFLLISGKPIGEKIARGGPFVMNTKSEILQANEDYHNGTFVK